MDNRPHRTRGEVDEALYTSAPTVVGEDEEEEEAAEEDVNDRLNKDRSEEGEPSSTALEVDKAAAEEEEEDEAEAAERAAA